MAREVHTIRPAGRHLLTIGRDLIQDHCAAVVELVKNAYDSDSPDVYISFIFPEDTSGDKIIIEDHGHGMSKDTVINKWLVPSTDDKVKRRISPGGRTMQGRKGIGRYSTSILGKNLLMETVTPEGEKTSLFIEWAEFEKADYLEDVEIFVDSQTTNLPSGTILTIELNETQADEWNKKQIEKLQLELKKLISPIHLLSDNNDLETFSIILKVDGYLDLKQVRFREEIKPFPLFDLFDYRIAGQVDNNGKGTLEYTNQKARNTISETIKFKSDKPSECGRLFIDIRVYDRESEAIDQLIKRGLKDNEGNYLGKQQAKQLINDSNGISVFRNGFRIRPLGDPDFDWLQLNRQRIQQPSLRIGSNQVIGLVQIQPEEESNLIEKSARDGLKENKAYASLKAITTEVISLLEARRFDYRLKAGLSRSALKVERELERLFSFDELKKRITTKLKLQGVDKYTTNEILNIITKKEADNNKIAEGIRQAVAIYQGHATLGKIINVILHEGRKPLNFFETQIPNFNFWANELKTKYEPEILDELIPIVDRLGQNADVFVNLFKRIDPLAARKRGKPDTLILKNTIIGTFQVFENKLIAEKIICTVNGPGDLLFQGWEQDIYVIMTNLIDNSIFWMVEKNIIEKRISVEISATKNGFDYLDYRDTGPGIESHLIESGVIFEPEFSTKPGGMGLGLALAGEAAARNKLELKAFNCETGAYFRLQAKTED